MIWYVKHITHAFYKRQETEAPLWEFQIGWNEKRTADPEPGYLSVLRLLSPTTTSTASSPIPPLLPLTNASGDRLSGSCIENVEIVLKMLDL